MFGINYRDGRPIYEQIVDEIEQMVVHDVLQPDSQLPSVRQMAAELSINPYTRIVIDREGSKINLTAKEFDLLYFLSSHKGQVFTKEQIYENVWGYDNAPDASNLSSFIRKLRLKIEPQPDNPRYIITVWGVGYKFSGEEKP